MSYIFSRLVINYYSKLVYVNTGNWAFLLESIHDLNEKGSNWHPHQENTHFLLDKFFLLSIGSRVLV